MIYTCDKCHITFSNNDNSLKCPNCSDSRHLHTFGNKEIKVLSVREATEREINIFNTQMGIDVETPKVKNGNPLDLFCTLEKSEIVFAKIGKSPECNEGKGDKYPYKIGLTPYTPENKFTFEPMSQVYNYLHYGDSLIVLSFKEMLNRHASDVRDFLAISPNVLNPVCFDANLLYVKEIISLKTERAIDYIVASLNMSDAEECLSKFANKGEDYYPITRYLEGELIKRFPAIIHFHTLTGEVEIKKRGILKKPKYITTTINIDYITFKKLNDKYINNKFSIDSVEIDGTTYNNVELDKQV